jgi:hypothetical protein
LKKTRTEIFKKWEKYENSIALNKISHINIEKVKKGEINNLNSKGQRSMKSKPDKTMGKDESQLYNLYVR